MSKYSEEAKEYFKTNEQDISDDEVEKELKDAMLKTFNSLKDDTKGVFLKKITERRLEKGEDVEQLNFIFDMSLEEQSQEFGEIINKIFQNEEEKVDLVNNIVLNLQYQQLNDKQKEINSLKKQMKENAIENNKDLNSVSEKSNSSISKKPEKTKEENQNNINSKETENNNKDQVVVMGSGLVSEPRTQSTDNSMEDDLYSKIMNINLNRAALIDQTIVGVISNKETKYHNFNKIEQEFLIGRLVEIAKQSSLGQYSSASSDKDDGKSVLLKHFDDPENKIAYNKLSESIPFKNTDYQQAEGSKTKTSDIKSSDGQSIGSLEKTERTINVDGKDIKVWQTKLNLDDKSNGFDVAAKLYLYDDKGQQSDLSIIIGKDKNGVPLISGQLDIDAGKGDDLVTLKRDGKTYVMPITYNDYEKYHEAMLNKTQFKDMNLSKNLETNKAQQQDRDSVSVEVPKLNAQQLIVDNRKRSDSVIVPSTANFLGAKNNVRQ